MPRVFEIRKDLDLSEIPLGVPRGRPAGRGRNQLILKQLVPDDPKSCIWMINKKRGLQITNTARQQGIRVKTKTVRDPKTNHYKMIIWRLSPHENKNNQDVGKA